jgi:hypothetical protein
LYGTPAKSHACRRRVPRLVAARMSSAAPACCWPGEERTPCGAAAEATVHPAAVPRTSVGAAPALFLRCLPKAATLSACLCSVGARYD